jgi:hypothetical protein
MRATSCSSRPTASRRFLDITLGSLAELSYAIIAIRDLELVSADAVQRLDTLRQRAGRLTWGLYRSVAKQGDRYTEQPSNIPTYRPITPPDAQS